MSLQALTLTQPWPAMMLQGDPPKRIENRDWTPPRKLLGHYLALHGGRLPRSRQEFTDARAALEWADKYVFQEEHNVWDDDGILSVCVPGIYAVARVTEVLTASDDPWFTGPFGWVLGDFVALEPPVPCRGKQRLWDVPEDILPLVRQRWKAARSPMPTPAPALPPALSGPVCGLCGHGEPDGELVACQLGWEAHEPQFRASKKPFDPVPGVGHAGVPRPLLSPRTRCMCLQSRWTPRRAS